MKGKLDYNPETYPIAEEYLILRFKAERNYAMALKGSP